MPGTPTEWTYHLQPIVRLHDSQVVGYEVLARFPDARPDVVFENARVDGTIVELDLAVSRGAVPLLQRIPSEMYLAINIDPETLAVNPSIQSRSLPLEDRRRIVAEISEQGVAANDAVYHQLYELRQLGMRYAVDDVGTAHGNVFRIVQFLPDLLKLDQSIIRGLEHFIINRAIVRGIVGMATELRIDVVAEGIETVNDLRWCRELGVEYGQGYLLGVPAPIGEWYPDETG